MRVVEMTFLTSSKIFTCLVGQKKNSAKVLRISSESVLSMPWSPLTVGSWKEDFVCSHSVREICYFDFHITCARCFCEVYES